MPSVALFNQSGTQVGEVQLLDTVFGIEPNEQVMFDAVIMQRASLRQGTHKTKTRTEVAGGGRKPWRQKGTGRARQGSIRSPQWRGGGVVFGPTPRDYSFRLNKKVRRLALKSALSSKVLNNEMIVLDSFNVEAPKTKEVVNLLNNLNVEKKALIVTSEFETNLMLSARNIPGVVTMGASRINVLDILNYETFIVTQDAVKKIEEVLG